MTLIVDGNNVVGTVPDGWWRDRPAAVRRLVARLQCHARQSGGEVVLVLDVPQPDLPEGEHEGVLVRYPERHGRDAADDRIRGLVGEGDTVVTSDRRLAADAVAGGARVVGAREFLGTLEEAGC